jgi:Icc-related predicted phosphoesterase
MTKVLIVGDLHGRLGMLEELICQHMDVDFVLQVGDFGAYRDDGACCGIPPRQRHRSEFPAYLEGRRRLPKPVFFVKGNHEHFRFLDEATAKAEKSEPVPIADNLFHIPNGRVINIQGLVVAGLGGNYSAACHRKPRGGLRRRHFSEAEISTIIRYPGKVDVLLTHDVGEGMIPSFRGLSQELLDLGRRLRPTWWVHGHFHCYHEADLGFTKVIGLDAIHGREISSRILEFPLKH